MQQQQYKVYVLRNPAGRRYIGVTENVSHRLEQHNAGESKWTAKFRPWELVWTSHQLSLSHARRLANHLKRQKGGHGPTQFFIDHPSASS